MTRDQMTLGHSMQTIWIMKEKFCTILLKQNYEENIEMMDDFT